MQIICCMCERKNQTQILKNTDFSFFFFSKIGLKPSSQGNAKRRKKLEQPYNLQVDLCYVSLLTTRYEP